MFGDGGDGNDGGNDGKISQASNLKHYYKKNVTNYVMWCDVEVIDFFNYFLN